MFRFGCASQGLTALMFTLSLGIVNTWAANSPEPDPSPDPDVPVTTGTCPDYMGALQLPDFEGPEQQSFQNWRNLFLSRISAPYHMVHDEVINPGEAVTLVGKFDYDMAAHKDLEDEIIHAYIYGSGMDDWTYLGHYVTDSDGKVFVPVSPHMAGEYVVRMVVEGDLSWADGFISVVPKGQQTVLFDIDGTLTTRDFEQVGDYLGVNEADSWNYAKETVSAYIQKGYRVIYVTGRPYWIARDTREWFTKVINLPQWNLRTNDDGGDPLSYDTETYKRHYLTYLQQEKGLKIIRAYGNASTDISAYANAGIPVGQTWIIGENAGKSGTQPLYDGYREHYFNIVQDTPQALCRVQ